MENAKNLTIHSVDIWQRRGGRKRIRRGGRGGKRMASTGAPLAFHRQCGECSVHIVDGNNSGSRSTRGSNTRRSDNDRGASEVTSTTMLFHLLLCLRLKHLFLLPVQQHSYATAGDRGSRRRRRWGEFSASRFGYEKDFWQMRNLIILDAHAHSHESKQSPCPTLLMIH